MTLGIEIGLKKMHLTEVAKEFIGCSEHILGRKYIQPIKFSHSHKFLLVLTYTPTAN